MRQKLDLPTGKATCYLSVINTTTYSVAAANAFIEPNISGHEVLNLPTFCYLIENEKRGSKILFDLGTRKDWWNAPPALVSLIEQHAIALKVDKDVAEILRDAEFPLHDISAVVLSHGHVDHAGNMSLFPTSTAAVVGPGFKRLYSPFYPAGEKSHFHEYEFAGRDLIELDFTTHNSHKVGGFASIDYFGDGSCYLLHTPGHTPEHLSALVRTTSDPDSFVFLGADTCHFMGVIRPTEQNPMPLILDENVNLSPVAKTPVPSGDFITCHPGGLELARCKPFYCVASGEQSMYVDSNTAAKTLDKVMQLDADPRVMIALAHDPSLAGVLPMFPIGTVNGWREKSYKQAVMWNWIKELPQQGERVAPVIVDGLYKDGKKVRGALQS